MDRGPDGLIVTFPNEHLEALKSPAWSGITALLGAGKEKIMFRLLLDCAIFVPIAESQGLYQLSGKLFRLLEHVQVTDGQHPGVRLDRLREEKAVCDKKSVATSFEGTHTTFRAGSSDDQPKLPTPRKPSEVIFARARMFYSRPLLSRRGTVTFGLGPLR